MGRLKVLERAELYRKLAILSCKKVLAKSETEDQDRDWQILVQDFHQKLRLDLKHLSNYYYLDHLKEDSTDTRSNRNYIRRYDNLMLKELCRLLIEAQCTVAYLQVICEKEMVARNKDKARMEQFNNDFGCVKQFDIDCCENSARKLIECMANSNPTYADELLKKISPSR